MSPTTRVVTDPPGTTFTKILADQPVPPISQQIAVKPPVPWTDLTQAAMRWLLTLHGGALVAHGASHGSKQHIGAGVLIGVATFVQSMISKFQKAGAAVAPVVQEAQVVARTVEPLLPAVYQQRVDALIKYATTLEDRVQSIEAQVQKAVEANPPTLPAVTATVTAAGTL